MKRWSPVPLAWNLAGLRLRGPESSGSGAERRPGPGCKGEAAQLALSQNRLALRTQPQRREEAEVPQRGPVTAFRPS